MTARGLLLKFVALLLVTGAVSFQIPHAGHLHPLYVRYRQEALQHQQNHGPCSQTPSASDIMKAQGCAVGVSEDHIANSPLPAVSQSLQQQILLPLEDATICTPVSYDEETGMVQTAVRAVVRHPISTLIDNSMVGLSSTLVITTGALHEVAHCLELEWTHHATSSTEGLAILSLGHFLHYGRETIRQLVEMHDEEDDSRNKPRQDQASP